MPREYTVLKDRAYSTAPCHYCGLPRAGKDDPPFMRGMVTSWWRKLLRLDYCAVICNNCKSITGWEFPHGI